MPVQSRAQELISRIDGRELGGFALKLRDQRPMRHRAGWISVTVMLADRAGRPSRTPLMTAIVSGGGRGVQPWIECRLYPVVEFDSGPATDARALGIEAGMISLLASLIPAGGHLMIDYESGGQDETLAELALRVPPAATHLGALMLAAGFSGEFKDWYFSEGGHEGPRKLQANKPPNPAAARASVRRHVDTLKEFLERHPPANARDAAIIARAQSRARDLLKRLRNRPSG